MSVVGVLHPGEMGAALGGVLRTAGHEVLWASSGRSPATAARAEAVGLTDVGTPAQLASQAATILSVCPPHAALDVATSVAGFGGTYVDANAVSPETARAIGERAATTFVDAGIIGPAPPGGTRLYLAGDTAADVAALFDDTSVTAVVLDGPPGTASALKMAYAGWTKGSAALLLAARAAARAEGVEDALLAEWSTSIPELAERSRRAASSATAKGWRFAGEMEEIAATLAAAGLPDGFHEAAADVYRRVPRELDGEPIERVLDVLLRRESEHRGESFGSVHVQTDDLPAVQRAVERFVALVAGGSRGSVVLPPRAGWISVYDELCDRDPSALRRLARELSDRLGLPVLALGVEDGAVVRYRLFDRGRLLDEYLSVQEYYGPLPSGEVVALAANPTLVERLTGGDRREVRAAAVHAKHPNELPPPAEIAAALGRAMRVEGTGHGYREAAELQGAIAIERG